MTSIEFKDVGIKLTVEPTVNLIDELTLKLKIEITRLGDQVTLQASPEIKQFRFGTRTAETVLNIKDDETVVEVVAWLTVCVTELDDGAKLASPL